MDRESLIKEIEKEKLIVIIRGLKKPELLKTVEAIALGGIKFCEITFSSTSSPSDEEVGESIHALVTKFDGLVHIGAGTVLTQKQVEIAKNAGAEYIISPDTNKLIIEKTLNLGLVSIPGAMTPTEISYANRCGGDFIKVFPSDILSPSYFKALKAPLSNIKLLTVGGINLNNITSYLDVGVSGFGIGSGIINKKLIQNNDYNSITDLAKSFVYKVSKH